MFRKKSRSSLLMESMTALKALNIGFIQGLAVVPGLSRSGSTIMGRIFGLK